MPPPVEIEVIPLDTVVSPSGRTPLLDMSPPTDGVPRGKLLLEAVRASNTGLDSALGIDTGEAQIEIALNAYKANRAALNTLVSLINTLPPGLNNWWFGGAAVWSWLRKDYRANDYKNNKKEKRRLERFRNLFYHKDFADQCDHLLRAEGNVDPHKKTHAVVPLHSGLSYGDRFKAFVANGTAWLVDLEAFAASASAARDIKKHKRAYGRAWRQIGKALRDKPSSEQLTPMVHQLADTHHRVREFRRRYLPEMKRSKLLGQLHDQRVRAVQRFGALYALEPTQSVLQTLGVETLFIYLNWAEAWWAVQEALWARHTLPIDECHFTLLSNLAVSFVEAQTGVRPWRYGKVQKSFIEKRDGSTQQTTTIVVPRFNTPLSHGHDVIDLRISTRLQTATRHCSVDSDAKSAMETFLVLRRLARAKAKRRSKRGRPVEEEQVPLPALEELAEPISETVARWPRYASTEHLPLVTHDVKDTWERKRSWKHARPVAQLRLFVASSMVELACSELGLPRRVWTPEQKGGACLPDRNNHKPLQPDVADLKQHTPFFVGPLPDRYSKPWHTLVSSHKELIEQELESYTEALAQRSHNSTPPPAGGYAMRLVAGCFPWGGRKQPHKTHKNGFAYDLQIGADSQTWSLGLVRDKLFKQELGLLLDFYWPDALLRLKPDECKRLEELGVGKATVSGAPFERVQRRGKPVWLGTHQEVTLTQFQNTFVDTHTKVARHGLNPELNLKFWPLTQRYATALDNLGRSLESDAHMHLAVLIRAGLLFKRRLYEDVLPYVGDSPVVARCHPERPKPSPRKYKLVSRGRIRTEIVSPAIARAKRALSRRLHDMRSHHTQTLLNQSIAMVAERMPSNMSVIKAQDTFPIPPHNTKAVGGFEMGRLRGTPLPHVRGGTQRAIIGSMAILLSGCTNVVYGSPRIWIRAHKVIHDSVDVKDPETAWPILAGLGRARRNSDQLTVRYPNFAFLPQNHGDHFHVDYESHNAYHAMYSSLDWRTESLIEQLYWSAQCWLRLGLDLEPFEAYVDASIPRDPRPSTAQDLHEASQDTPPFILEYDGLKAFLAWYRQEFRARYDYTNTAPARIWEQRDLVPQDALVADEEQKNIETAREREYPKAKRYRDFVRARLRLFEMLQRTASKDISEPKPWGERPSPVLQRIVGETNGTLSALAQSKNFELWARVFAAELRKLKVDLELVETKGLTEENIEKILDQIGNEKKRKSLQRRFRLWKKRQVWAGAAVDDHSEQMEAEHEEED